MLKREARKKTTLLLIVIVAILFNLYTFIQAYPETFIVDSGCCANQILAKDFSAYYTASWRLIHDPSNVYNQGAVNDGEPSIYPQPEPFKYLPSFLILASPLLFLSYQQALIAFDLIQLLLLPVMAFLIYELLKDRSVLAIAVVMIIALLQPSPVPHWGLSVSYYWQWAEGQDKVLNTTLLLLSFYLGQTRRPIMSGIVLGLGAFDPRFFLLSLPLFGLYNKLDLKKAGLSLIASLVLLNFPLLIDGIGSGFLKMVVQGGASTPLYYYALIPLLTLVSLIILNGKEILLLLREFLSRIHHYSRWNRAPKTITGQAPK
ncbi:MAG: glycosyltransferase family 87 protein [Candidatus Bathyarchaeia archaeon]|jgi:hypothetical protein